RTRAQRGRPAAGADPAAGRGRRPGSRAHARPRPGWARPHRARARRILRARARHVSRACGSRTGALPRDRRLAAGAGRRRRCGGTTARMAGRGPVSGTAPDFAPWQRRIHDQAAAALDAGRLGHAQLFCGPAHMGKHAVALQLARRLMCAQPVAGAPCGRCRGCELMAAGSHPDFMDISFVPTKDGSKLRTEIVIEQIRTLSEQLGLTPQFGGAQVAIIAPADAINHAASNALLKTLEEPVPGRYLWLVSARPERLSATIRSRCQRLEFRLPPRDEARAWLQAQGHAPEAVDEALDA